MGAKFIIGLTDVTENESFFPTPHVEETYYGPPNQTEKYVYILQNNNISIEKASIEWQLDMSLPAVVALLDICDAVKSQVLNVTQIYAHKFLQEVLPSLYDTDFIIELKTLIPNPAVVFPEYTNTDYENVSTNPTPIYCSLELDGAASALTANITEYETINSAMFNDDLSFLIQGPQTRYVYPTFRVNFRHNTETTKRYVMDVRQQQWMDSNKDALESKGYFKSDIKNKIGALTIGELIGNHADAFAKAQQYNRICRVEIVRD
jgi:hypothetical protein